MISEEISEQGTNNLFQNNGMQLCLLCEAVGPKLTGFHRLFLISISVKEHLLLMMMMMMMMKHFKLCVCQHKR